MFKSFQYILKDPNRPVIIVANTDKMFGEKIGRVEPSKDNANTTFVHEGTITTKPTFVHEDNPTHNGAQQEEDLEWARIWSPRHSPLHLGSLELLHTIEELFTKTSSEQQSHHLEKPRQAPQQSATHKGAVCSVPQGNPNATNLEGDPSGTENLVATRIIWG